MVIDGIQKNVNKVSKKDAKLKSPPKYKLGHVPPKSEYMHEQVCWKLKQTCKYLNSLFFKDHFYDHISLKYEN